MIRLDQPSVLLVLEVLQLDAQAGRQDLIMTLLHRLLQGLGIHLGPGIDDGLGGIQPLVDELDQRAQ